ncbi:hypothetical protein DSCO28_21430 [Desulfosarcina ovata subsp. sediminis]|uniref:VacJ n=1 Tax=Desulfosarcina ovata subsp. sediminis TaxID=885957 RepID=A0A5K7ZMZ1_9BACT|nr:hypothetical protein [Desulfosarcina ovata]BBO81577.1 hypothetical protein DSCO28_21430 [Desulfosarcina ovata subsp. sediminis]
MDSINRQVAVIKPKDPYIKWINSLPGTTDPVSIDELQDDCTAILLPHFDTEQESMNFLKKNFRSIFENELFGWHTDEKDWPKKLSFRLFQEWFEIELHTEVIDFGKGSITIEKY